MKPSKIILYADDDADDKAWISEACKALECDLNFHFVENGKEVFDYLEILPQSDLPSLIALDLNMPRLDGRQTLKRLKSNSLYQQIPVIIITTSSSKIDIEICKKLGAALYLTKPDTHTEWQQIVRQLEAYINS